MSTSEEKCLLCQKKCPENEIFTIKNCNHKICHQCLVKFITLKLKAKIKCPINACPHNIPDQIIRECLSNDQIKFYEKLSIMGASSKVRKCPMEGCVFMFFYNNDEISFSCSYCESPICIKCNDIHFPQECGKNTEKASLQNKAMEIMKKKKRSEFIALDKLYYLLPNHTYYTCSFCLDFILPRKGVTLRNCLHCFCCQCLKDTYSAKTFIGQFKCQICNAKLEDKELNELIGEKRYVSIIIKEAKFKFYNCKKENCDGMWDYSTSSTSYKCPECGSINCMECYDIHVGVSCAEFKKSKIYLDSIKDFETIKKGSTVNCQNCKCMLTKAGGCNAIHCNHCGHDTCLMTGLFAGRHDIKTCGCQGSDICKLQNKYCNCTHKEPCHPNCLYGCIPDI